MIFFSIVKKKSRQTYGFFRTNLKDLDLNWLDSLESDGAAGGGVASITVLACHPGQKVSNLLVGGRQGVVICLFVTKQQHCFKWGKKEENCHFYKLGSSLLLLTLEYYSKISICNAKVRVAQIRKIMLNKQSYYISVNQEHYSKEYLYFSIDIFYSCKAQQAITIIILAYVRFAMLKYKYSLL